MAYDGFEAIREEEIIFPMDPLNIIKPGAMASDDLQLVSTSTPPPPPQPQVNTKRSKKNVKQQNTPARETRSKSVKPSANTRSKSKI